MDEEEYARKLLARIAQRDMEALDELRQRLSRYVNRYLICRLDCAADAEEVYADTIYEVWKGAGNFRGDSTVRWWVVGIAKNKMLMKLRSRSDPQDDIESHEETLADDTPAPFEIVAASERTDEVQRCLKRLSRKHYECLSLAFYQDFSEQEIADLQGIPRGTVKSRLSEAKRKIKKCLERLLRAEGS